MPTTSLNRRQFLRNTTWAALAAPAFIPAAARGADGQVAPSNRITLGFIGVGKQSLGHLHSFLNRNDVEVLAVCDVDRSRRENALKTAESRRAKRGGTGKACAEYVDFRELIARPDIDAVVIGTPDHWHAIPAIYAAQAGKDIYCEKPMTLTLREGRAMVNAVRRHNRIFQTGSQQRSSREFRKACELVRNGRIGKIKTVRVQVGSSSKWCDLPEEAMEPGLEWDLWLGPAPRRAYNSILSPRGVHNHFPAWREYREYSGGGMTDWGAHHFDIAQWGLGMDDSGPVEIIPPEDPKARYGVRFIYANGVEVVHEAGNGVTFTGTDGEIYVNRGKFKATPESAAKEPLGENETHLYESNDHHGNWLDCIRSRKLPICDVEIGARSVSVCHLGNLAYWLRRPLRWNPEQERFIDDAEANTHWLDVNRRDPWRLPA